MADPRPDGVDPTIRRADPLPRSADLVVVGGGIIGCATAFFAARAGLEVLVLERRTALATLTTAASTGAFRLQFDNREEIELVREGVEMADHFAERTGLDGWDLQVNHGGYLFCSLTDATLERSRRLVERQRQWGLTDVELLDGDELRARWPWLSPDVVGGRYRAADGWLDVKRLAVGYASAASRAAAIPSASPGGSASFATGVGVTDLLTRADGSVRGVRTSGGEIESESVVLATGPFLAALASTVGLALPVAPTRRQKMVIPLLPLVPADAPMTIEEETAAHWRPTLGGCLALFTEADTPHSDASDPVPVSHEWALELLDPASDHGLARVAPFWSEVWADGAPTAHWYLQAGQYEYTPDRRPLLGASGVDGLWLNGGYSGHGIMAGTAGSRLVVELLTGARNQAENPFRSDRSFVERPHDIL